MTASVNADMKESVTHTEDLKPRRESMNDTSELAEQLAAMAREDVHDPEATRRLVRKIDLRLMPIMCLTYALQYYDKVLLGHAAIFGLIKDTHLDGGPLRYSNASMIFYVGYIVGCYPISYLGQRLPTGKVCAVLCIIWSAIVLSTVGCKSYSGIMVNRFMLGVIESGIAPNFMLVVSMWYTKREQLLRSAFWYSFSGGANLVVPIISYGVGAIHGGSLKSWQYMYLLAGSLTFLWSFVVFFFMPDSPITAKGFTEVEIAMVMQRLKADNAGVPSREFKPRQILECVTSINFWCVNVMSLLTSVTSGPISSFGSIIFKAMGFSSRISLLLNMPNGAMAFFCVLTSAYLGRKIKDIRLYLIMIGCPMVVIGAVLVWQLHGNAGRLVGFYLMNFFSFAYVQVIGLGTCNVAGYTKRATTAASVFVSYCIGSIIGPLMFNANDAPRYEHGFIGTMICLATCFFVAIILRFHLARENRKRDEKYGAPQDIHGLEDITDKENKDFRFQL